MSNWKTASLEEMTPPNTKYGIVDGPFGSNLKTIHYKASGIPIITSGFVTEGVFRADKYLYVTREKYEAEKRSSVSGGDIVMAKIGARCGASAMLPLDHETGILSGNALKITIDKNRYSAKLVWQILWMLYRNGSLEKLKTVGAQPAISMSSLKKLKLTLPDLNEQNQIVAVLDSWDEYLELFNVRIKLKQNLQKGLLQKLITGNIRTSGSNDHWQELKLGEIGSTYAGLTGKAKDDFGSGKPYITYMNVYSNPIINTQSLDFVKLLDDEGQNQVKYGDILFTTSSETPHEVGIASVYLGNIPELYLNSFCFGYRLKDSTKLSPRFARHYFRAQQFRKNMTRIAQGASRYNLSKRYFMDTIIRVPSDIAEQERIADLLDSISNDIEQLKLKKRLIEQQREYLVSNLVSGNILIPEPLLMRNGEKQHA